MFKRLQMFRKNRMCSNIFRVLNPHQRSLAKQSSVKSWKVISQKWQKHAEANSLRDGVLTHTITISINFNTFHNASNQSKSTVELGYMCLRGLTCAVTITK